MRNKGESKSQIFALPMTENKQFLPPRPVLNPNATLTTILIVRSLQE